MILKSGMLTAAYMWGPTLFPWPIPAKPSFHLSNHCEISESLKVVHMWWSRCMRVWIMLHTADWGHPVCIAIRLQWLALFDHNSSLCHSNIVQLAVGWTCGNHKTASYSDIELLLLYFASFYTVLVLIGHVLPWVSLSPSPTTCYYY